MEEAGASPQPPLSQRETSSLLRRNVHDENYDVLVSNELLRMAEDGGGSTKYNYVYNGRQCKGMKVKSADYTRAVSEFRKFRRQSCMQIAARVCQMFAFIVSALAIMIGVIAISVEMSNVSKELQPVSTEALNLRGSLIPLRKTVNDLNSVVTGLNTGISTAGTIVSGVQDVVDTISNPNNTAEYVGDVIQNSTQIVNQTISGLQDVGGQVGQTLDSVLSGNTTLVEGLNQTGQAFADFGQGLWETTQQTAQDIAGASVDAFCGALSFLC